VGLGAIISCFGALNGWILLQGQIPLAAAMDGLFPGPFARVSGRGTPVAGLLISSFLVTILVMTNYTKGLVELFTFAILLATLTCLVPYVFSTMAELILLFRERERFRGERLWASATIAILAFLYSLWAIAGSGRDSVYWGFLLLMCGLPVYVWVRRRLPE
jgi:APA family basic amino acid/polyamine antiporter